MPVMMRWGRFIFSVPTYSVEELKRKVEGRVSSVPVVGAVAQVHTLGANPDTITLQSTFYPHHLNRFGLTQLRGIQAAVRSQEPSLLVHGTGSVLGMWVGRLSDETESIWGVHPVPQKFVTSLALTQYIAPEDADRQQAIDSFISISI
ncbi:Phage P2 GpU [Pseudovibrio axinellae]|uniref:Phage P2 GpU n=1 Tax=Pseudovibrio axinellae TaxID=989403 RepID=A0A165XHF3_9HYPH|nr:phage tail protein [Pseudovibrio axinellae]KZL17702.1 Phage P2 GpU [Pseudovibrio axinellae]SER43029.1 Phage protein U [Pseudovibrio axinellae]